MDEEQRQHLRETRVTYQRRLRVLERQAAFFGPHTPPHIILEIDDLNVQIAGINSHLGNEVTSLAPSTHPTTQNPRSTQTRSSSENPLFKQIAPLLQVLLQVRNIISILFGGSNSNLETDSTSISSYSDLDQALYRIAYEAVVNLDFVGSRISVIETDDKTITARAYFVDPNLLEINEDLTYQERVDECERQVKQIEHSISRVTGKTVSLKGLSSQFDMTDEGSKENLGVRAITSAEGPIIKCAPDLFSVFTPVLKEKARLAIRDLQCKLGIHEVVAVPLLAKGRSAETQALKPVGVLFVASRSEISNEKKVLLTKLANRAAQAIFSAQIIQQLAGYQDDRSARDSTYDTSNTEDVRNQINSLIAQHWLNYHEMEIQKAKHGNDAPSYLGESMNKEIDAIQQLKQWFSHL